jgi:hypothetical protein
MNAMSRELLTTFEGLPQPEQQELAEEILRLTLERLSDMDNRDWMYHAEEIALAQEIEFNSIE